MQAFEKSEVSTSGSPKLTLLPAKLDFTSVKTQFLVATVLVIATALAVFGRTLSIGFLGDDFLHIEYLAKAFRGDWDPFLNNFVGNWANSDVMKSYRPLTSVSLFLDYLIWKTNAAGFHLTNVMLLAGCAFWTGMIALELTGQRGNRLGATAAMWSALLFAVYPLHAESTAWIIGRVDLLCTFFYLCSLFCYLRFRLLREKTYLDASVLSFFAALLCKEMAITLPAVIFFAELLLFTPARTAPLAAAVGDVHIVAKKADLKRFTYLVYFVMALGMFATIRFGMIGTAIGGYGDSFNLSASITNLLDKNSWFKVLYPATEEQQFFEWLKIVLFSGYAAIIAAFAARLMLRGVRSPAYLFLLAWMAVSIVPAFQIWHIYPNLSGSRMFFMSSAPFCILLVLLAVPAIDVISKKYVKPALIAGLIALATVFACWCYMLHGNLQPWLSAGAQLQRLQGQAIDLIRNAEPSKKILLAELPADYQGAMMVAREQYLMIQLKPPFTAQDLTSRVLTTEPVGPGSHEFIWPGQLADALKSAQILAYKWYPREAKFIPFGASSGVSEYAFKANETTAGQLKFEPPSVLLPSEDKWRVQAENAACVTKLKDCIRIYPGKERVVVSLPRTEIDPRKANVLSLGMNVTSNDGCKGCYGDKVTFFWDGEENDGSLKRGQARLLVNSPGHLIGWLGRYRDWTMDRRIAQVGFTLEPGEYYADFRELRVMPADQGVAQLKVLQPQAATGMQPLIDPPDNAALLFDVSSIQGSRSARIVFTRASTTFDARTESDLLSMRPSIGDSADYLAETEASGLSGVVMIPDAVRNAPGVHQARAIAVGEDALPRGLGSEPITIIVNRRDR